MRKTRHETETITATKLARNLSHAIDQVRISGHGLSITKGSQTIAELRPPPKNGISIKKLEELLNNLPQLNKDTATMAKDLKIVRNKADLPDNPWD